MGIALLGGFVKPIHKRLFVSIHALAFGIQQGEIVLGFGIALISGHAKPLCGLRVVFRHARIAEAIYHAEAHLRFEMALLGGLAKPFCGFCAVFLHALAFVIHIADEILRLRIALLGNGLQFFARRLVVLAVVRILALLIATPRRGRDDQTQHQNEKQAGRARHSALHMGLTFIRGHRDFGHDNLLHLVGWESGRSPTGCCTIWLHKGIIRVKATISTNKMRGPDHCGYSLLTSSSTRAPVARLGRVEKGSSVW